MSPGLSVKDSRDSRCPARRLTAYIHTISKHLPTQRAVSRRDCLQLLLCNWGNREKSDSWSLSAYLLLRYYTANVYCTRWKHSDRVAIDVIIPVMHWTHTHKKNSWSFTFLLAVLICHYNSACFPLTLLFSLYIQIYQVQKVMSVFVCVWFPAWLGSYLFIYFTLLFCICCVTSFCIDIV